MKLPPAPPPDAFLEDRHLALADRARVFGEQRLRATAQDESHAAARTREIVSGLASAGLLRFAVAPPHGAMDLRSLVAIREQLAYFSSLADTAFAMQGLGSHVSAARGPTSRRTAGCPRSRGAIFWPRSR